MTACPKWYSELYPFVTRRCHARLYSGGEHIGMHDFNDPFAPGSGTRPPEVVRREGNDQMVLSEVALPVGDEVCGGRAREGARDVNGQRLSAPCGGPHRTDDPY